MTTKDRFQPRPPGALTRAQAHAPDQGDSAALEQDAYVALAERPKTDKPPLYKVLLLNDDYTPMEFVVEILESLFHKTRQEATQIMLHVHQQGVGLCGVYTYDVAQTKAAHVHAIARQAQHPLRCTIEKE